MSIKKAKERIKSQDWYYQGSAVRPLYVSYPWFACSLMKLNGRRIPVKYDIIIHIHDDFMDDYISKNSLSRVALYYFNMEKQKSGFIRMLFDSWHKNQVDPFRKLSDWIIDAGLKELSDDRLSNIFSNFNKLYLAVWSESIFLDGFDFFGEKIVESILKDEKLSIPADELHELLAPPLPTFTQKERLAVSRVLGKVKKSRSLVSLIKKKKGSVAIFKKYSWLEAELNKISCAYYWIQNDYASIGHLDSRYYYSRLREMLENVEGKESGVLSAKVLDYHKQKLLRKYKISSRSAGLFAFLSLLGNFRDERKSYNQMAGNVIKKLSEEYSNRLGIDVFTFEHLFYWEIELLKKNRRKFLRLAEKRKSAVIHLNGVDDQSLIYYGKNALSLNAYVKKIIGQRAELKGRSAFGGFISGKVKIIKNKGDFRRLKKGDILVAPNTRPEYLPIMKIAGAIITDEGGATCHAAIVSRELKIPCIVGMQGATSILKDNDIVEVDASRGVIKILK